MAITTNAQIQGQEATSTCTYCYLYEPLRVVFSESDLTARTLYIDLEIIDTSNSSNIIATEVDYGVFDINPGAPVTIDLMRVAQQYHDADLLKFAKMDSVETGWQSVVSKYKYNFKVRSDVSVTPISIVKLPIIGNRSLKDFTAQVTASSPLNEFDLYGIDMADRFTSYDYFTNTLADPTAVDSTPTITKNTNLTGTHPCGGYIIWKSRFGGWCSWGFRIKTEKLKHSYSGRLDVGMFEGDSEAGGNPYVEADYTSTNTSITLSLKALSLNSDELLAVNGINATTAVYFAYDDERLELMRLSSASAPISNLSSGGDFSVSLKSISNNSINTK